MKTLLAVLVLSLNLSAYGWNERGNGGDTCENRIQEIAKDFEGWLQRDQFIPIVLPTSISKTEYKNKMLDAIHKSVVSCTSSRIFIGQAEKTCKNTTARDGSSLIECNVNRFNATSSPEQYKLIHHEFAGVAGFETNQHEASDYRISSQISDFLKEEIVLRLGVKPARRSPFADRCVKVLTGERTTTRVADPSQIEACAAIKNEFALDCVRAQRLPDRLNPEASKILFCADVRDEYSLGCVKSINPRNRLSPGMAQMKACLSIYDDVTLKCVQDISGPNRIIPEPEEISSCSMI